jgi:hypothetical protein
VKNCKTCGHDYPEEDFGRFECTDCMWTRKKEAGEVVINPAFHLLTSVWKVDREKALTNATSRRWRAKHKEQFNAINKAYRERPEIKAKRAADLRKWRAANRMKGQQSSASTTQTSTPS